GLADRPRAAAAPGDDPGQRQGEELLCLRRRRADAAGRGRARARHRLRRQLRAVGGPRPAPAYADERLGRGARGDEDRRRDLHLHPRPPDGRGTLKKDAMTLQISSEAQAALAIENMTPRQIVVELDKYVVG